MVVTDLRAFCRQHLNYPANFGRGEGVLSLIHFAGREQFKEKGT